MARPDVQKPKPDRGILSNVFSFVSREFESFLVNATSTGRPNQPASTARVKSSGRRRRRGPEGNLSEAESRHTSRTRHHQRVPSRPKPRSKSTDSTGKPPREAYIDLEDDQTDGHARSKSPAHRLPAMFPVPELPKLKKQPSLTMPGALFPRSPSLIPDQLDSVQAILEVPPHPRYGNGSEAGPSTHSFAVPSANSEHSNQLIDLYVSPWRTRSVSSVKDAVNRFNATDGIEADFSLMLPSPHSSPGKPVSKSRSLTELSPQRLTSNSTVPSLTSRKGKERAREVTDEDLDFIVSGSSEHGDVYAKERELDVAREEQREHEKRLSGNQSRRASDERERDKRRIKALEEEVRQLKEELSRSQLRSSPPPSIAPPPAPPPPPLPPVPLPLRIDTTPSTPTSMFATARASLRHAMTPIEAPINNVGLNRTKRQGQPTVNVPSEKMAAFLLEIKTAKLRRVGSGLNAMGGDGVAGPSGLSKSVSVASLASETAAKVGAKELLRRRSLASLRVPIDSSLAAPAPLSAFTALKEPEVRVGQKRKADALGTDNLTGTSSKRRMTQSSSQSSSGVSQEKAASSSEISLPSSPPLPPRSLPTNETDITTPSLCSDNEREGTSIEDRVPSTPPGPRANAVARKAKADTREERIEVVDAEMTEHPHPRTISPSAAPRRTSDLFKKRPPTSPIPFPTPRRPTAPARTKRGATPMPKSLPALQSDEDDDDEAPPRLSPVPHLSLISPPASKASKPKTKPSLQGKGRPRGAPQQPSDYLSVSAGSGSISQTKRRKVHKRRQTLDEELRLAEAHSSDIDQCNDEQEPGEEDVFIATGTKSKHKGFLAHGGGGGAPVFMGVGYVRGVVPESGDEGAITAPRHRRLSKSAGPTSLIPRLKVRK